MAKIPNFNKKDLKGNKNYRNIGLYLLMLIITVSIISSFFEPKSAIQQELTYSEFLKEVLIGKIVRQYSLAKQRKKRGKKREKSNIFCCFFFKIRMLNFNHNLFPCM